MDILETLGNAKPPHGAETPLVGRAAVFVAIGEIMHANKFAERVFTLVLAGFCVLKCIVIIDFDVKTSFGVARVGFVTVVNVVARAVYVAVGVC